MTAENGAMTPEQEQAWRTAIRSLAPSAVAALLLECSTGDPKWVRLTDLTGPEPSDLIARVGDLLPLLHDDIVRRMDKSARQVGRGT